MGLEKGLSLGMNYRNMERQEEESRRRLALAENADRRAAQSHQWEGQLHDARMDLNAIAIKDKEASIRFNTLRSDGQEILNEDNRLKLEASKAHGVYDATAKGQVALANQQVVDYKKAAAELADYNSGQVAGILGRSLYDMNNQQRPIEEVESFLRSGQGQAVIERMIKSDPSLEKALLQSPHRSYNGYRIVDGKVVFSVLNTKTQSVGPANKSMDDQDTEIFSISVEQFRNELDYIARASAESGVGTHADLEKAAADKNAAQVIANQSPQKRRLDQTASQLSDGLENNVSNIKKTEDTIAALVKHRGELEAEAVAMRERLNGGAAAEKTLAQAARAVLAGGDEANWLVRLRKEYGANDIESNSVVSDLLNNRVEAIKTANSHKKFEQHKFALDSQNKKITAQSELNDRAISGFDQRFEATHQLAGAAGSSAVGYPTDHDRTIEVEQVKAGIKAKVKADEAFKKAVGQAMQLHSVNGRHKDVKSALADFYAAEGENLFASSGIDFVNHGFSSADPAEWTAQEKRIAFEILSDTLRMSGDKSPKKLSFPRSLGATE